MRANLKKYISLLICTVMLIGYMPLSVMASLQKHIKLDEIRSIANKKAPSYGVSIKWTNPSWNTPTDVDQNKDMIPEGFKIEKRRADGSPKFELVKDDKNKELQNVEINEQNLEYGSIYEYQIRPYHSHVEQQGDKTVITEAPYDPATPLETALFMTDIKVDAKGYGNILEVTFDNPTYDNKNVFTGYRIYYQQGGKEVKPDGFHSSLDVKIDDKNLVVSKDNVRNVTRFTYKINNENIKPSNVYAVKVEPLYNGSEIRSKETNRVNIDGKTKLISFNEQKNVEYRTNDAYVAIPLFIFEDGKDYIKLQWGDVSGLTTIGEIEKIEVLSGPSEESINTVIGTIHGPTDVTTINSWQISKPKQKTYYKVKFYIKGVSVPVESLIAVFDPAIVNITPNKPDIYPKSNVMDNKAIIDLYWDTFMRAPYNEKEEASVDEDGLYFDTDVEYDIWITDSLKNFDKLGLPKIFEKLHASKLETTNIENVKNKVFYQKVEQYVTVDEKGSFITKPLVQNRVYYIKIIATKPTSDGLGLSAPPAYSQIYLVPNGDISDPKSLSKPPLRVKKDENGNDLITQKEITVQWNTKWFEVYDKETDTWHSNAAIRDGKLIFGKEVKDTDKIIDFYDKNTEIDARLEFSNAGYSDASSLLFRTMDLTAKDIQYEMLVTPFADIDKEGGYEKYIEALLQSDSPLWQKIEPTFTEEKYAEYLIKDLKENTTYAILLRPFRILDDGKKVAFPTYILATTLPPDTTIEITPTIPTLFEVSKTDTSIEVEWQNQGNTIIYELVVDENVLDDPSKAKIKIDSKTIKENAKLYTKEDKREFLKYNIEPLFPDTGYYIWIRAIVEQTGKTSDWSTPLYVRTEKLRKPEPPSGFGLASEKSLSTYNTNNNTDFKPITDKYLVLEWLRDADDKLEEPKATTQGTVDPLLDPNIKRTYMAKFNNLIPNRYYYTRAKTKLTVAKSKDGGIEKYYSYIIQVSPNPDFKDAVQIEIPTVDAKGDRVLVEESDWTTVYKYRTRFSTDGDGDYDSNIVDDLYPLPTEDFEIVYDAPTQTLTYRFRSNKKDGNGNADNLVDQRFITKLINNKVFNYNIDLTSHKGYAIKNRRVELPYSIISTLDERKIALSITTGGTRFTLNSGFLNTPEVKNMGKMGLNTTVAIDILENPDGLPILAPNQIYATTPEYIKISVNNNNAYKNITYTGSNMDISLKLKNRSLTLDNNVGAYRNIDNATWERVPSTYNNETGIHTVKTNRLGKYTTITNGVKQNNSYNDNIDTIINVNNKITFTDVNNLDTKQPISVVQFNNIVAGVANNKKQLPINGALSNKDYQSLQRSGMLLQGSVVAKEAGINSLVKLYEMKTKSKYELTTNINTTPFKDIRNANPVYQNNLLKAGELGFFGNNTVVNPKNVMTIEEMLSIVDIILADSGY